MNPPVRLCSKFVLTRTRLCVIIKRLFLNFACSPMRFFFHAKGIALMDKRDTQKIKQDFTVRRTRQIIAIATAAILVLLVAALYKRPDLFGTYSKDTLALAQVFLILAFINFTAFNWRCPSCKKHIGNNINQRVCKQCGVRLQ